MHHEEQMPQHERGLWTQASAISRCIFLMIKSGLGGGVICESTHGDRAMVHYVLHPECSVSKVNELTIAFTEHLLSSAHGVSVVHHGHQDSKGTSFASLSIKPPVSSAMVASEAAAAVNLVLLVAHAEVDRLLISMPQKEQQKTNNQSEPTQVPWPSLGPFQHLMRSKPRVSGHLGRIAARL